MTAKKMERRTMEMIKEMNIKMIVMKMMKEKIMIMRMIKPHKISIKKKLLDLILILKRINKDNKKVFISRLE
jgi:hypothetical protein